jgi:hypothetical protein
MESFLNNKNALIWAFNENIDKNTKFEGNTKQQSIDETKILINYLCFQKFFDTNITQLILTEYLEILNKIKIDFPIYDQEINSEIVSDYFLLGWKGHAILLFFEKIHEEKNEETGKITKCYNLGLINCGEGISIQGHNGILCNGLIIFKNIDEAQIIKFFNNYRNYNEATKDDETFDENKVYHIFYFILNYFILETGDPINYEVLIEPKVSFYKLESQLIGSCTFTNIINFIYYIQLIKQNEKGREQCYSEFLIWYNNCKKIIKKKIFEDILISKDFSYYNMYQYILDTTDATKNEEYEYLVKNRTIDKISYSVLDNTEHNLASINRDTVLTIVERTNGIENEQRDNERFEHERQYRIEQFEIRKLNAPKRIERLKTDRDKLNEIIRECNKQSGFSARTIEYEFAYTVPTDGSTIVSFNSGTSKDERKRIQGLLSKEFFRIYEKIVEEEKILTGSMVPLEKPELSSYTVRQKLEDDVFNKSIPLIKEALWDSYDNHTFTKLCEVLDLNNYSDDILKVVFGFYKDINLMDNGFALFYILYKINKEAPITDENYKKLLKFFNFGSSFSLNATITNDSGDKVISGRESDIEAIKLNFYEVLKSCILLLIKKDKIPLEEKYYSSTIPGYATKKRKNIIFYNSYLFSNFPIINCYYEVIVSEIINEFNENIEIFPDSYRIRNGDLYINTADEELKDKFFFNFIIPASPPIYRNYTELYKNIIISKPGDITSYLSDYILFDYSNGGYTYEYENYGYYIPDVYASQIETNRIIDTEYSTPINLNPGGYKLHKQKIILFKEKIKANLIKNILIKPTFDLFKEYTIYFYLCELDGTKIEDTIFNKYNENIHDYFEEKFFYIRRIIYTYILKYSQTFVTKKYIIFLNDTYLITNSEKKYFQQKSYECTLIDNIIHHSIIDFFIIKCSSFNVIIYKDEKNTVESISIIKDLTIKYDTIYFALNFYFSRDGEKIIGINKNNDSILLTFTNSNDIIYQDSDSPLFAVSDLKKIIKYTDLPSIYQNFYNLMSNNDVGLFIYTYKVKEKKEKDVYFLKTLNYDFIFKMCDGKIFYTIKEVDYIVNYCNDIDIINNYGILKLQHPVTQIYDKLLCIYNYKHILSPNRSYEKDSFINNTLIKGKKINDILKEPELNRYYYKIISKYNNKYIFTNIDEVNALLINCFNYNSPYLILKNIEQIKNIINNYSKSESIFVNTLFTRFINIYSVPISLLFYNDKILNEYYYFHTNSILKKYDVLLELKYFENKEIKFYYNKLKNNIDELSAIYNIRILNELFFLNSPYFSIKRPKKIETLAGHTYLMPPYSTIILYTYNTTNDKLNIYEFYYGKITYSSLDSQNITDSAEWILRNSASMRVSINIIVESPLVFDYDLNHSLIVRYAEYNIKNITEFEILSKLFIPISSFNEEIFRKNIDKATELYNYLISDDKKELFPIQELIMGSGKTTSITPYICILLLNNFLSNSVLSNKVFIIMPEFLINSSFEILMKYLFPLFNNIEIIINSNKREYENSLIINLISDNNYKLLFLENIMETSNSYMIYDEVDMMANPLTCELNIPSNKISLKSIDNLYKLSNAIYNDIFKNDTFWTSIENSQNNKIHNYIYNLDKPTIDVIDHYYNEIIEKYFQANKEQIKNLLNYVKENILYFLLTKQYNFDYGIPQLYYGDVDYNYKYKAIPYTAVDSPAMGSEFSDSILTYILTIFCYKIVDGEYRKIDKEFILDYYEQNKELIENRKFFKLFDEEPYDFNIYLKNKDFYKSKLKNKFLIDDDIFDNILRKLLNLNDTYYKNCKNISFNDLLLHKNVKNFISFTGTAYIRPPIGHPTDLNFNFNKDAYINFSKVDRYASVLDAIFHIIDNPTKLKNINTDQNLLIEDIFCCLNQYEVLIDIGGIFIKYNINSFIEEYKKLENIKDYIVYFDNGRKILNIKTNQFVSDDSISHSNAFYYFSNKNITGVDAKNIMNPKAHGLVTITNKTILRDFSQGIFRMRNILDNNMQTFDIIFNKKYKKTIVGGCDSFEIVHAANIRDKIKESLCNQQMILDKQKEKILIKQNIFGLKKPYTSSNDNQQILYLDPMTEDYNSAIDRFNTAVEEYKPKINIFNIDSLNIIDKTIADNKELVNKYFTLDVIIYEAKQNVVIEQEREVAKEREEADERISEKIKQKILLINTMIQYNREINNKPGVIYYNLRFNAFTNNQIIVDSYDIYDLLLIYDSTKNNLAIISTDVLDKFLMYNENILEYTYISLYDNSVYGRAIDGDLHGYLIRECAKIFIYISRYAKTPKKYFKLVNRLIQFNFNERYVFGREPLKLTFIHFNPKEQRGGSYYKYKKYKEKYLQLKEALNL